MIGTVIGRYRIERELSEGGMSHVYVGRTIETSPLLPADFAVVLKIMSSELASEVTARKRFIKEAQILSRLRHKNITRFFEFIPRDTGAVLVMEFVEGEPVDFMITKRGALPVAEAVRIVSALLEALVYAHGKGIVHRDIKPANLICDPTGIVKVTDFGIAKIKEASGGGHTVLTKSGLLLGTPHYMSPEQIREPKDAGAPSDIYSTGVLLYEMLTATLPFNSNSLRKLIDAIYRGEKKPPSSVRPDIDPTLDEIVMKALHFEPAGRFQTAGEFLTTLKSYAESRVPTIKQEAHEADDPTFRLRQLKLELVSMKDAQEKYAIQNEDTVGRDKTCRIVISHPAVSRVHARFANTGAIFFVEDLKSSNGTFINNQRVERASIKPGDIVRFGADPHCSFQVRELS